MNWMTHGTPASLRRTVLRDEIKDYILNAIIKGSLSEGDRIVETQLARHFGVSQTPVREALRELEQMGVIQSEPHRGASVRVFSAKELQEMYSVRATLEEMAAREATKRIDEPSVARLDTMVEEMVELVEAGDIQEFITRDVAFHRLIVELSGNCFLLRIWELIHVHSWTTVTIRIFDNRLAYLARRHSSVVEALKSGDPHVAGAALREHIEQFGTEVAKLDR